MQIKQVALGVIVVLLVVGASATGAIGPGAMNGASQPQLTDEQQPAVCNYVSLYNQTIDSVVAIRTNSGLGSGFIYQTAEENTTSHIVTNAHVVGNSDSVLVQFAEEESKIGAVVGSDRFTDLAVIRVNETPSYVQSLPVTESPPNPGRKVAAIGTPFGLDETITHGIISGLNRSMPTRSGFSIPSIIQTDAPINPGNSGGPLVTCDGTVVGVNSAGISASRAENVGFAVSGSLVNQVVPSLIQTGEYDHAYLGISTTPLTPRLITANDLDTTTGVYVHEVAEDGPASAVLAGTTEYTNIEQNRVPVGGDVITNIDGHPINSQEDLAAYLMTNTRPGDEVTVTIIRDGDRQQRTVTLGERPEPSLNTGRSIVPGQ